MDAITLLKNEHAAVSKLARDFARARRDGDGSRTSIASRIADELRVHITIEEEVFYPAIRREVPGIDDDILESYEEHHIVQLALDDVTRAGDEARTGAGEGRPDSRYDAKVAVLLEIVRLHVSKEEDEWFPKVRRRMSRARLSELGSELAVARQTAAPGTTPDDAGDDPSNLPSSDDSYAVDA